MRASGAARDALVAQSKAHLEVLEMQRKLYLRSRSLSLAQRALLYAHDELDMSMMRMQLRAPGEAVKPHEQHFRLQPFEVPLKNRVGLHLRLRTHQVSLVSAPSDACLLFCLLVGAAGVCYWLCAGIEQGHSVQELTNDRLGSEADLTRLLGTLRYLHGLKVARQQVESAAASGQENPEQHQASASATLGQTC